MRMYSGINKNNLET